MRCIIAGSRTMRHLGDVAAAVEASGWEDEIAEVVSGCAGGADRLGRRWANLAGIPVRDFPADWNAHGKAAGPLRNEEMACYADALIAVWDGESRGTADMIRRAHAHGLRVYIHEVTMKIITAPPPARVTCVVCEELLPTAEDGAPLCVRCGHDPAAARRRVLARLESARAMPRAAWLALNRAVDALSPEETERWGRMRAALDLTLSGVAAMDTVMRVREMWSVIDRGKAPAALAAVCRTYEANWWAREEGAALAEKALRQLERLDKWLAAAEKEPAHAD